MQEISSKRAGLKEEKVRRSNRIFRVREHDCRDTNILGCLEPRAEETTPQGKPGFRPAHPQLWIEFSGGIHRCC